jgi:hypothetical protein
MQHLPTQTHNDVALSTPLQRTHPPQPHDAHAAPSASTHTAPTPTPSIQGPSTAQGQAPPQHLTHVSEAAVPTVAAPLNESQRSAPRRYLAAISIGMKRPSDQCEDRHPRQKLIEEKSAEDSPRIDIPSPLLSDDQLDNNYRMIRTKRCVPPIQRLSNWIDYNWID